ncbi:MAG: thioredoxin [Malacoplasma sp.]|nr:thioredoxin [Malacoplasma sp.]MDE7088425.1 thioredoxin [Malacoplasma sp.]
MNEKIKYIELNELKKQLNKSKENFLVIFYADWCPYCINNVPIILKTINTLKLKNFLFVNISDDTLDVWKEDGNTEWAIELVPTIRIYQKTKKIYEHKNVIGQQELINVIKEFKIN